LHSANKLQMTDAFDDGFKDKYAGGREDDEGRIDQLLGDARTIKKGDQMVFTYVGARPSPSTVRTS